MPGVDQIRRESLRAVLRRRMKEEARGGADGPNPAQIVLGALLAEARELLEPPLEAGSLERVERIHAEGLVELPEPARAEARNAEAVGKAARKARPKLVVERQSAGRREGVDVGKDRVSDSRKLAQAPRAHPFGQIAGECQKRLRGVFVGADLEAVR